MPHRAIGLMSGTSGDGVDAVLLELDSYTQPHMPRLLARSSVPFSAALSHTVVHPQALTLRRLTELHFELPALYAEAVRALPGWARAEVVAMHGQTVTHQVGEPPPAPRGTLQVGSGAALAELLGLPVVADLRSADVALGGQGAPIAPFAHWFFLAGGAGCTAVVNLGGICNVTVARAHADEVVGFDVGPAMMVSDAYARLCTDGAMDCDRDGTLSAGGRTVAPLLEAMLAHPFVQRTPPKSAGREEFGRAYYEPLLARFHQQQRSCDIMHTLHAATARMLADALAALPPDVHAGRAPIDRVLLTGGGAHNPTMQACMRDALAPVRVEVPTDGPLAPQNHEPAAMALIGLRTLHGLPCALPRVTGAPFGTLLGHVQAPLAPGRRLVRHPAHRLGRTSAAVATLERALTDATQTLLRDGAATAAQLCVLHDGEPLCHIAEGTTARWRRAVDGAVEALSEVGGEPVTPQTAFDVASLTKVVATTAAAMALVSDGRLALHARAATFLPQLRGTDKDAITLGQLLQHRSGLAAWAPLYLLRTSDTANDVVAAIAREPLQSAPGAQRRYSDLGYILLGRAIEAIVGEDLGRYLDARLYAPLQLIHTRFCPPVDARAHIVATAHDNAHERRMIDEPGFGHTFAAKGRVRARDFAGWRTRTHQGEANDGNAHHACGGIAGHAGLFSTAQEVARIAAAMVGAPLKNTDAELAPDVVTQFLRPDGGQDHLGWANPNTWRSLAPMHATLAEHGCLIAEGFTGTMVLAVPTLGLTMALLTNRQHQGPEHDGTLVSLDAHRARMIAALLSGVRP